MGALKKAGYRSAKQYMEVATAQHVAAGNAWTGQLAQARRLAIRRMLGSPMQASGLPLPELGRLVGQVGPLAAEVPVSEVRSTLLAPWLLGEIEASRALTYLTEC